MENVSGFGLVVTVTASNTFPNGFNLTAFADDADALDLPEIKIGESAVGLNGDLITWTKAVATEVKIAVIEGSDDDVNLGIIFDANRVGKGKTSARDVIEIVALFPSGATNTFESGIMTAGQPGPSVSSAGRLKTKVYTFTFESTSRTEAAS
jgi:hypothetical protein